MKRLFLCLQIVAAALAVIPAETAAAPKNAARERIAVAEPRAVSGVSEADINGRKYIVEIRSLNGKSADISLKTQLIPREKVRTKSAVIRTIVDRMQEHAEDGLAYSGKCYISMSACYDDARAVADLVEERFPKLNGKVVINSIGTTIGSHTGPGTVALFFWGSERID